MLSQERRMQRQFLRKLGESERHARNIQFTEDTIVDRTDRAAGAQMGVMHSFSNRQHWRNRYAALLEDAYGFVVAFLSGDPLFDDPRHFRLILDSLDISEETRIVNKFWFTHCTT